MLFEDNNIITQTSGNWEGKFYQSNNQTLM